MKTIHSLIQGSDSWHEFRRNHDGASEAAVMLGLSKKTTRTELLRMKTTGTAKEFSDWVQKHIFDHGHEVEALARPLIEDDIGEDLYPVTCSDGRMSASCDGLSLSKIIGWEHKQWNEILAAAVKVKELPDEFMAQPQQCMMVTGAKKWIFTVSDGTSDKKVSMEILPDPVWFERIRAGWVQFNKDRENYVHEEAIPVAIATPIRDLPAITYKMDGLALTTNLQADVKPAILALVEQAKKPLENDQDFADLAGLCKKFKAAEDQCALVAAQAVGEIKDVDAFCRDLKELQEIMAAARIAGDKRVVAEKESRKLKIIADARHELMNHVNALYEETKPIEIIFKIPDFGLGIKGMAKLDNIKGKCADMVAEGRIAADAAAKEIRRKLAWYTESSLGYAFLFNDLQQIIVKPLEDFQLLVDTRIDQHKQAEAAKMEAERARIKAEEELKARAKVEAEQFAAGLAAKHEAERIEGLRIALEAVAPEVTKAAIASVVETGSVAIIGTGNSAKVVDIRQVASARPSRIQMIEAVAQVHKLTYAAAEQCLRAEFERVAA